MNPSHRPSPALIVALIALVAALAGSAVALPGKNKVDKNDIKKNAIQGKQVKNDTLTGDDVDESTLGQVPSAATASSAANAENAGALNGLTRIPPTTIAEGAPEATLATVGAFTIGLACNSAATSATGELRIRTSVADSGWESGADDDFNLDPGGFGTLASHADNDAPDTPTFSTPNDAAFGAMTPDASTALDGSLQLVVDGGPGLTGTCTAWGQIADLS
jgi:hypothetical protein